MLIVTSSIFISLHLKCHEAKIMLMHLLIWKTTLKNLIFHNMFLNFADFKIAVL